MHYSLLTRDVERDVIPMMRRYRLGLTVWSPLASGFLSGKYTRDSLSDPDNRCSGFDIIPFDKEHGFKLVERMRAIAGAHNASVAQVAIAWLLSRDAVPSMLIGATKEHQLQDNLAAANLALTGARDPRARCCDAAAARLSQLVHRQLRRQANHTGAGADGLMTSIASRPSPPSRAAYHPPAWATGASRANCGR